MSRQASSRPTNCSASLGQAERILHNMVVAKVLHERVLHALRGARAVRAHMVHAVGKVAAQAARAVFMRLRDNSDHY